MSAAHSGRGEQATSLGPRAPLADAAQRMQRLQAMAQGEADPSALPPREAVPSYDKFIEPVLRFLAVNVDGREALEVYEAAANYYRLSPELRLELLSSGKLKYKDRIRWAHDRLKRAGLSDSPTRGIWRLTPKGIEFANRYPSPLPEHIVAQLATKGNSSTFRSRRGRTKPGSPGSGDVNDGPDLPSPDASGLATAIERAAVSVVAGLRERVRTSSRTSFRAIVADLLTAEGYGPLPGPNSSASAVDGVCDAGAKRGQAYVLATQLQRSIGAPRIEALQRSMQAQNVVEGLIVSTSDFNKHAIRVALAAPGVRLIGGRDLAALMIQHKIGVTCRSVEIAEIDVAYFENIARSGD